MTKIKPLQTSWKDPVTNLQNSSLIELWFLLNLSSPCSRPRMLWGDYYCSLPRRSWEHLPRVTPWSICTASSESGTCGWAAHTPASWVGPGATHHGLVCKKKHKNKNSSQSFACASKSLQFPWDLYNVMVLKGFEGFWMVLRLLLTSWIHTQGLNFGQKCYQTAGPLSENFYRSSWSLTGPSSVANNNMINTFSDTLNYRNLF